MGFFSSIDNQCEKPAVNGKDEMAQRVRDPEAFQRVVLHAFRLQPVFREVFLLCDVQECTIAEAAAILNISPAAAAVRLDRARRLLDAQMGEGPKSRTRARGL